jgi:hypothetical protein
MDELTVFHDSDFWRRVGEARKQGLPEPDRLALADEVEARYGSESPWARYAGILARAMLDLVEDPAGELHDLLAEAPCELASMIEGDLAMLGRGYQPATASTLAFVEGLEAIQSFLVRSTDLALRNGISELAITFLNAYWDIEQIRRAYRLVRPDPKLQHPELCRLALWASIAWDHPEMPTFQLIQPDRRRFARFVDVMILEGMCDAETIRRLKERTGESGGPD